jgi:hypothetical protein
MANITISDLRPAGYDLLSDSESYMSKLSVSELDSINGGLSVTVTTLSSALCRAAQQQVTAAKQSGIHCAVNFVTNPF